MKKAMLGLLIFSVLVLGGCTQQQTKYVCPDGSTVSDASYCPKQETQRVVQCNFASDCPNGYCDVDTENPKNNKCVYPKPGDFCGNGLCEGSRGENPQSCPTDCR